MPAIGLLSKPELKRVSGFGTRERQTAWLRQEGIPFKLNGKEELVVSWHHVNAWLEGREQRQKKPFNWAALNA